MPLSLEIDQGRRRVFGKGSGEIGPADFVHFFSERRRSFYNGFPELLDFGDATANFSGDEIKSLATARRKLSEKMPPAPVAYVARNEKLFAAFRMLKELTEDIRPIEVFRNLTEAERWLDNVGRVHDEKRYFGRSRAV